MVAGDDRGPDCDHGLVGGATRLTESGLSIVEWKPVTGTLPPLNEKEWTQAFDGYKAIPQYRDSTPA